MAYSYDELKRLTQVANGTATQQEAYQYDPLGNRTQKSVGAPSACPPAKTTSPGGNFSRQSPVKSPTMR
jgi:YD repeat-containing protein